MPPAEIPPWIATGEPSTHENVVGTPRPGAVSRARSLAEGAVSELSVVAEDELSYSEVRESVAESEAGIDVEAATPAGHDDESRREVDLVAIV